jgi:hypothetical protein
MGEQSKPAGSNPARNLTVSIVGANPTAAAIYVDDDSGELVHEDWWPGDAIPERTT